MVLKCGTLPLHAVRNIDQRQHDIIRCAMHCGKEKPCVEGLLAEWGLKPMHMWLHQRAMEYCFRVKHMPAQAALAGV
jgi:hypothetical protein